MFDRSLFIVILLALFFCASSVAAQSGADFLVVERPQNLSVLNQYQMRASATECAALVPFAPLTILQSDELLTDGFTHCMQVEYQGKEFFLVKTKEGKLSASGALGYERTFINATPLFDTVEVLKNASLKYTLPNSHSLNLKAGQKVLRMFRHRNEMYCRILDSSSVFGWIHAVGVREGKEWEKINVAPPPKAAITAELAHQIHNKVEEVNRTLAQLFSYFDSTAHQQKLPPQWGVDARDDTMFCAMQSEYQGRYFQQSTVYLAKDIQNIVLGFNLEVESTPGKIIVRAR